MNFMYISLQHLLIAFVAFTCITTLPHFAEAGEATPPGGCNSVDGISCPARDPINAVSSGYDPTAVNWGAVLADIESIGKVEPRWCSFVIRAWFHDSSSIHTGLKDDVSFNGANEGSLLTDEREFTSAEGSLHGWSPFARHVVVQLSATHGASLTDIIMVSAAKCTSQVLGGTVDIADHCEAAGFPLSFAAPPVTDPFQNAWPVPACFTVPSTQFAGSATNASDQNYLEVCGDNPPSNAINRLWDARCILKDFPTDVSPGSCMQVGKLDREVDGSIHANHMLNKMAHAIPAPGNRVGHLLNFFTKIINKEIPDGVWHINPTDTIALMGSHTIMMTQGCSTGGTQKEGVSMSDRTCGGEGGRQKMFTWDNSFFQDISAGKCTQNSDDENRREMTMEQAQDFRMCGFNSMEGFELGETLECSAMSSAEANAKNPSHPDIYWKEKGPWSKGWEHVKWQLDHEHAKKGNYPSPCCGHQCEDCGTNPDSKFWCGTHDHVESAKGPGRMWPYTYMDSELNWVYLKGGQSYCDGSGPFTCGTCQTSCNVFEQAGGSRKEIMTAVDEMQAAIELFRVNRQAWEEAYAVAFCKMSEFGANYAPGRATLNSVLSGAGGSCLSPEAALSLKSCEVCKMPEFSGGFSGGSGDSGASISTFSGNDDSDDLEDEPMGEDSYDDEDAYGDETDAYDENDGETGNGDDDGTEDAFNITSLIVEEDDDEEYDNSLGDFMGAFIENST